MNVFTKLKRTTDALFYLYFKIYKIIWDSNQNRIRLLISKVNINNYEYLGDISMKKVKPNDRYNYIQKIVLKYQKLKNLETDFE